jgi:hypothetical protein
MGEIITTAACFELHFFGLGLGFFLQVQANIIFILKKQTNKTKSRKSKTFGSKIFETNLLL